jgi:FixJ family two-component response regulator
MNTSSPPLYVAIVDDDESLCRSLARLLRASGMQPIAYASAEDFLADDKSPRFDCVVLDVQLGGMSGIELARRLRARGGHPPFIFITAHDDAQTHAEAMAAGCAAYFRKNDPGADIVQAIRRLAR